MIEVIKFSEAIREPNGEPSSLRVGRRRASTGPRETPLNCHEATSSHTRRHPVPRSHRGSLARSPEAAALNLATQSACPPSLVDRVSSALRISSRRPGSNQTSDSWCTSTPVGFRLLNCSATLISGAAEFIRMHAPERDLRNALPKEPSREATRGRQEVAATLRAGYRPGRVGGNPRSRESGQ